MVLQSRRYGALSVLHHLFVSFRPYFFTDRSPRARTCDPWVDESLAGDHESFRPRPQTRISHYTVVGAAIVGPSGCSTMPYEHAFVEGVPQHKPLSLSSPLPLLPSSLRRRGIGWKRYHWYIQGCYCYCYYQLDHKLVPVLERLPADVLVPSDHHAVVESLEVFVPTIGLGGYMSDPWPVDVQSRSGHDSVVDDGDGGCRKKRKTGQWQ